MQTRRRFIKSVVATSAATSFSLPLHAAPSQGRLRMGLIADVHKDIIHDADLRLQTFIDAMKGEKVDAILQLGDFCRPKPANQGFRDIFNQFNGPRYHVIGNHEMDGGFSREAVVKFLGMKSRYYSFDQSGCHFVVLDANDRPEGWKGGYPSFIAEDQVAWLREDLAKTTLNTFIISHQSLERPDCIRNQEQVRAILEEARMPDGKRKVAACLNGHWHIDYHRSINGIPYLHINSASYFWLGGKFQHDRLDPALAKQFPYVSYTAPYTRPLFTILEIDPKAGRFSLASCGSDWMGPSPQTLGFPVNAGEERSVSASISEVTETF